MATRFVAAAIVLLTLCACSPPDDADAPDAAAQPAPADAPSGSGPAGIARNPDRNPYFGDLHVHTNLSFDAYLFGTRRDPDDAYAFAKGGAIDLLKEAGAQ